MKKGAVIKRGREIERRKRLETKRGEIGEWIGKKEGDLACSIDNKQQNTAGNPRARTWSEQACTYVESSLWLWVVLQNLVEDVCRLKVEKPMRMRPNCCTN